MDYYLRGNIIVLLIVILKCILLFSIHHVSGSVYEVACEKSKQRLRMSRSIGDFYLKQSRQTGEAVQSAGSSALPPLLPPQDQAVSCVPDVVILQRDAK